MAASVPTRCHCCISLRTGVCILAALFLLQILYVVLWRRGVQQIKMDRIYILPQGQLGNHMFQYAYGYALRHKANRMPIFSTNSELQSTFTDLSLQFSRISHKTVKNFTKLWENKPATYMPHMLYNLPHKDKVHACCNFESWHYFEGLEDALHREFTFQAKYRRKALAMVERVHGEAEKMINISSKTTANSMNQTDVVLVAIHVRRGDLLTTQWVNRGWRPAPVSYFQNAMQHFQEKFQNVHFLVCSDSLNWCKKTFNGSNISFCDGKSHIVDMVAMTMCDHMIMSVGTFGFWAAWLNGGDIVYYDKPARPGSGAFKAMTIADFYLPSWTPISA